MKLRVPATSANLGPGFDCFGLAWQLYNEIEFLPGGDGLLIDGCPEAYRGKDNLAWQAYAHTLSAAGLPEEGLRIRFTRTDIPLSHGLGSSSALLVAGVLAADALHGLKLSRREMLALATALEGHPDNVAPALLGGLTVSALEGEDILSVSFALSDRLHFAALVPPFELSTALARSILPASVPRADAIFNISRAALVLKALETGDAALLAQALRDRLHQPYRATLIQGYEQARELALANGAAALCISGAGPTLLCAGEEPELAVRLEEVIPAALPGWRVLALRPDFQGGTVLG